MVGRPVEQLFPKVEIAARSRAAARRKSEPCRRIRRRFLCVARRRNTRHLRPGGRGPHRARAGAVRDQRAEFRLRHARGGTAGIALVPEDRQAQGASCHSRWPRISRCPIWPRSRRAAGAAARVNRTGAPVDRPPRHQGAGTRAARAHLSGGNQQKVVIAKWLARKPGRADSR